MKTVAIIQARMGSTRLPGKVMKPLCGQSVLAHVITRVQRCSLLDDVIVATTTASQDDRIEAEAEILEASCFRGSEADVLERYYLAANVHKADIIVRITSDCPLFDSAVLTEMLELFRARLTAGAGVDYLSNTQVRRYPIGLDAEIFTFAALEQAFQSGTQAYQREHVTPYIYQNPDRFSIHQLILDRDLSSYRWTLDTLEDWQFIQTIYERLYPMNPCFLMQDVLGLLEQEPELLRINSHIQQKKLGE